MSDGRGGSKEGGEEGGGRYFYANKFANRQHFLLLQVAVSMNNLLIMLNAKFHQHFQRQRKNWGTDQMLNMHDMLHHFTMDSIEI